MWKIFVFELHDEWSKFANERGCLLSPTRTTKEPEREIAVSDTYVSEIPFLGNLSHDCFQ
jgi:hypothetical protein